MSTEVAEIALMTDSRNFREPERNGTDLSYAPLIVQAKSGDSAAFEQLIMIFQRRVFSTAWRMLGNEEDARDAAQEAFLRTFKYLGAFKLNQDFSGWLYRIVINACRDLARKRRYRDQTTSIDAAYESGTLDAIQSRDDVEAAAIKSQELNMISEALSTLSKKERAALVLRDLEGLPTEQVARILGSSQATVRSQISSARTKIKLYHERLKKRGRRL